MKNMGLFAQYKKDVEEPWAALTELPFGQDSAWCFLHGVCGVFALALHDVYGYALDWCIEDDFEYAEDNPNPMDYLVHVFCYDEEKETFIDVRGATEDMSIFFEEFEDFFTPPGIYVGELDLDALKKMLLNDMGETAFNIYYTGALRLIEEHPSWYTIY